jgi:2-dehydro-3-deoxyphosphogluconate aldolase/(4S)-4-hydroxy-2-oxoglutarate aldolase
VTTIVEDLRSAGLVAVVRGNSLDEARKAAAQARAAGVRAVEVTYTVPNAEVLIRELAEDGCLVGAGTVLQERQVSEAADCGATFVVSAARPSWLVREADRVGMLAVPGCATPHEVWGALEAGATVIKIFPVSRLGGPAYLRDLSGPFPNLQVMASGGVRPGDLEDYRAVGTWCIGVNAKAFSA